MTVIYEKSFNENEWFVIVSFILLALFSCAVPKILSLMEGIGYFVYGIFFGTFFDLTLSIRPLDLYDVNDTSDYQFIDFVSLISFGFYSYFFTYLYVKLRIMRFMNIVYVLIWTSVSLAMEWIGVKIGLYHFDKGYKMYWSIPIYLLVQSIQILYFHISKKDKSA